MIGCPCATCNSKDPRDRRLRPSILVSAHAGASVLVDTGPDLRQQALTYGLTRIDAILYTHSHADHVMGLDDVRRFNSMQGGAIPAYADAQAAADIRRVFQYIFDPPKQKGGGIPQVDLQTIDGPVTVGTLRAVPIPLFHGSRPILGFRFGSFAYLTDCNRIPDDSWPLLAELDTLVIDALRHRPHPTHFSVAEALQVVERVAPRQAYFTHMCHDLAHEATNAALPDGVALAYDGLQLDIDLR